jgi:2Fe-2S ferredoxin
MPSIVYVQADGSRQTVEASPGSSVMATAVAHGVPGIVAECGGSAMCATCHVYVDTACIELLPPISEVEDAMLASTASERRATAANSRPMKPAPMTTSCLVWASRSRKA